MNRYTFKAKRKDNGEWVYGNVIINPNSTDKVVIVESGVTSYSSTKEAILEFINDYVEIIPETLCQCTGLQDFSEHDLVKYEDENEIYEIVWFDEDCYFGLKGKGPRDTEMLYYKDIFKYLKLLGNKFDKEVE